MVNIKTLRISLLVFLSLTLVLYLTSKVFEMNNSKELESLDTEIKSIQNDFIINQEGIGIKGIFNSDGDLFVVSLHENGDTLYIKKYNQYHSVEFEKKLEVKDAGVKINFVKHLLNHQYLIVTEKRRIVLDEDGDILLNSQLETNSYYIDSHELIDNSGYVLFEKNIASNHTKINIYKNDGVLKKSYEIATRSNGETPLIYLSDGNILESRYSIVSKYDTDGNEVWKKYYSQGTDNYNNYYHEIIELRDGNILLVGSSKQPINSKDNINVGRIIKIDPNNGDIIWDHVYGGKDDYLIFKSVAEIDNEIIVMGINYEYTTDKLLDSKHFITLKLDQDGNQLGTSINKVMEETKSFFYPTIISNGNQVLSMGTNLDDNNRKHIYVLSIEESDLSVELHSFNKDLYKIQTTTMTISLMMFGCFVLTSIIYFKKVTDRK